MASVKELKKDIDLILSMVLSDCFYVLSQNEKVSEEAVTEIAADVIKKHRELRVLTNHPDGKDNPKLVKKHYKQIVSELLSSADAALERLSAEVKKTV